MEERSFQIVSNQENKRLDKVLADKYNDLSRSYIQKLIKEKKVKVNNKHITKKSFSLTKGDNILISIPPPRSSKIKPEKMDLNIIFEDKDLIVLNKSPGIVVHPAPGNRDNTLVHGLLAHTEELSGINGIKRPGIVHRLDKDTSGTLIVAKNDTTHRQLVEQFKNRKIEKIYKTVIKGKLPYKSGKIDAPIGRDINNRKKMAVRKENSKKAVTRFKLIKQTDKYSFVRIKLETGRTHQIRVHFSYIGHPVVGDKKYGNNKSNVSRQLLHAYKIGFFHPNSEEWKTFTAPLPEEFNTFLDKNLR